MGAVKSHFHDEICAGASDMGQEPDILERLRDEKDLAMVHWTDLIQKYPASYHRTPEQIALIDKARELAIAARNAYWDAGGK